MLFVSASQYALTLVEFKNHLAGNIYKTPANDPFVGPSLELQKQFLTSYDNDEEATKDRLPTDNAVLISPCLESRGYRLPPQYALLGGITTAIPDSRVMLNTNIPFSAFVCGVQGSGKSHTAACMIGMFSASMDDP